jgi:putative membrane protein
MGLAPSVFVKIAKAAIVRHYFLDAANGSQRNAVACLAPAQAVKQLNMENKPGMRVTSQSDADHISVELSSRRTGMSFQRTRMSADRTLMSVIRTSLSLITFGFTIFQVFQKLHEADLLKASGAARHFGVALVLLGIAMLVVGIGYHLRFMYGLRKERAQLRNDGLVHAESQFPVSLTLVVALLLLAIGFLAIASMLYGIGPFG